MSALGLKVIDETVQQTNIWLKDLAARTGWEDKQRAYRLLRATLHVLRDRLPVGEAVHLGAEMPLLIRGMYFEGWRPEARTTHRVRSKADFVEKVREGMRPDQVADAEAAVEAVFALLADRISAGEMRDVRHDLPEELHGLFAA